MKAARAKLFLEGEERGERRGREEMKAAANDRRKKEAAAQIQPTTDGDAVTEKEMEVLTPADGGPEEQQEEEGGVGTEGGGGKEHGASGTGGGEKAAMGGEEEEKEAEVEEEEEGDEEEGEGEERPKLEDGYYEMEDIRKRRLRKGQLQYLVKWQGWPESANTWEPRENLQSCEDIIEAFEERLRSPRTSRKRRRKSAGAHSSTRKRQASENKLAEANKSSLLGIPDSHPKTVVGAGGPAEDRVERAGGVGADGSHGDGRKGESENGAAQELGITEETVGDISVQLCILVEDDPREFPSKVESMPPSQDGDHFTGTRKRKSGRVKRFKQDGADEVQKAALRTANGSSGRDGKAGAEDFGLVGDEVGDGNKFDDSANPTTLIKILKATNYSFSMANDMQDLLLTFAALRSDGEEVSVDNNFMKEKYPQLLISFYEQHLRCSRL